MGAMGAALDIGCVDVPHGWNRDGLVLGLLRAWLGWVLVLGSGRKCITDAVACRHSFAALGRRHGKAGRIENLDTPACNRHFLLVAYWHIPGALGCADFGAYLRERSRARNFSSCNLCFVYRRRTGAVCLACLVDQARRSVRTDLPRRCTCLQQPVSYDCLPHCLRRDALSIGARGADR